ncbi:MAG TPA: methyltransferase domain-containing protein [Pyrinomonadaceae bacterium]|jgi:SAM-dependent methyltransferase|nr:methyltransferase domain-containing protein [Pyrinomonadaceae bacterium]
MKYALFNQLAHRYDWHTPPHHYQDDHSFVLSKLPKPPGRIIDMGCGTGVFLEKALAAGFNVSGFDASLEMVQLATNRIGKDRVQVAQIQDFEENAIYNGIVSLCWSFNYIHTFTEASEILTRCFNSLLPGGRLILQLAHAANVSGILNEDREPGPKGQPNDVMFLYRFRQVPEHSDRLIAQYVYGCKSEKELLFEEHQLAVADVKRLAAEAEAIGYEQIELLDSWKGEPFKNSINVFLLATRR